MLEVLINNEAIGLEDNFFNLNNLITDFENPDKTGASYTNTLKAPNTPRNQRIFGFINYIGAVSSTPYERIFCKVRYFGVEIDPSPYLYLQGFDGEYYNFNIFFSISSYAQNLSEKTLQTLNLGSVLYQISNMNFDNSTLDYINAYYLKSKDDSLAWYNCHFAWKAKRVLTQIIADSGYSIIGGYPDTMDWLDETYVLPTNEKLSFENEFETDKQALEGLQKVSSDTSFVGGSAYIINFNTIEGNATYFKNTHYETLTGYVYSVKVSLFLEKISLIANFGFTIGYVTDPLNPTTTFVPLHEQVDATITGVTGTTRKISYTITVAKETIPLNGLYVRLQGASLSNIAVKAGSYFEVKVANYVPEGLTTWQHADSLPSIKQRDYLKSVLFASGCVMNVNNWTKEIKFIKILDILENVNYLDWTNKIDFGQNISITYNPNEVGQTNVVKFRDTTDGSTFYNIANENLESKKEFSVAWRRGINANTSPKICQLEIRAMKSVDIVLPSQAPEDISIDNTNMIRFFSDVDYKKQDLTFGRLVETDGRQYSIYHNPLNFPSNEYEGEQVNEVRPNTYLLPANAKLMQGYDSLQDLQSNFDYTTKVYSDYRQVKLRAKLSLLDIISLSNEIPIFIGANIQRKFVLMGVTNWKSPYELCDVELVRINEAV
jgi:hypothetical protein